VQTGPGEERGPGSVHGELIGQGRDAARQAWSKNLKLAQKIIEAIMVRRKGGGGAASGGV